METFSLKLTQSIEYCLLPKLARNFEECVYHTEFNIRNNRLDEHFHEILKGIEEVNLKNIQISSDTLASFMIIYYELQTPGPWNIDKCKEYSTKLDYYFELFYEISLRNLFLKKNVFNVQEVFDMCLEKLHQKLSSTNFKKYPSLIEVYISLIQDVQNYNIKLNPISALPVSLLLIDDYTSNKIKGLKCCKSILRCLSVDDFVDGNYYEVIYGCLKRSAVEKDKDITKLVFNCFLELLKLLPSNVKINKTDELYSNVLEQLHTETNLYRKKQLFSISKDLIHIHGLNCTKKKKVFLAIVCDNLDVCCNEAVAVFYLSKVLESLEEWIKHCWCTWELSAPTDQKLLSELFKLLYMIKDDKNSEATINLIVTLISLCTLKEQKEIVKSLKKSSQVKSLQFSGKIELVKKIILYLK